MREFIYIEVYYKYNYIGITWSGAYLISIYMRKVTNLIWFFLIAYPPYPKMDSVDCWYWLSNQRAALYSLEIKQLVLMLKYVVVHFGGEVNVGTTVMCDGIEYFFKLVL